MFGADNRRRTTLRNYLRKRTRRKETDMVKINVISGFLGAGKTTLIKKLLTGRLKEEKVVLLENEYGEIGIDGGFMKDTGITVTELNAGCICCTLAGDFQGAIDQLIDTYHPDRILVEPTGVGKLSEILSAVEKAKERHPDIEIGGSATVVDAGKCRMYMKNFSALSEETKKKLRALIEELDHIGSNKGLAQAVQKFNKIKIAARDAGEEGVSFFSKMGKQIEHLNAQAFAMYLSWQDIIRYIRQAAGAVIELDSALTELRKVSDASTERLQQSFETSAKTAKELGSTVDSVINQTADWSRLNIKVYYTVMYKNKTLSSR